MACTVAVLAVQGAFIEHERRLAALGCDVFELRKAADLASPCDALVLPGGESTVQSKLLHELNMFEPLRRRIDDGLPVLGTCAGLILLSEHIEGAGNAVDGFSTLPVTVRRNGYGRQLGSFRACAPFGSDTVPPASAAPVIPMTFIRAPFVTEVGEGVEVLATVDERIVGVRCRNQIGVAFHPELDEDNHVYEQFLGLV